MLFRLTHKQLQKYGSVLSTVADVVVLDSQAISTHSAE